MCNPVGMRVLMSTAALFGCAIQTFDAKSAFLQIGRTQHDVYVIPNREARYRGNVLWLMLTAAYGLVNANSKRQHPSDDLLTNISFTNPPST